MTNYNDLGLNQFLQPTNSPVTNSGFVNAYQFDSNNERGAITSAFIQDASINNAKIGTAAIGTANIGTLTFNEISGGTATFGGTTNGNGLVEVLNEAGGTVVQLNKDGLQITNGSISVQNSSGSTSFDQLGVVSEQNFFTSTAEVISSGTQETSSYSFVDIVGGSMSFTTSRTRLLNVDCQLGFWVYSGVTYGTTEYRGLCQHTFYIDGTLSSYAPVIETGYFGVGSGAERALGAYGLSYVKFGQVLSLSAGTHTLKLQSRLYDSSLSTGTPVLHIWAYKIGYTLLGT